MTQASSDDDKTIIGPSSVMPDRAHEFSNSALVSHTLPVGTRLGEFEITGLIGEGGFGIVYLAYDASLQRQVALKEYMPSSLASRSTLGANVAAKSERHAETFKVGLRSFVNEARLLARFDHPALVKVYRFWEANGTAYMVMPYYQGPTLKAALAAMGERPDEATLRGWLRPLLDALEVMHQASCYHRDIAPDNILLTDSGPLLLDFGAARRVVGDMTHALTVVLKPGYAPIEQYGEAPSMTQGAWTDLYALACVVYYAITGSTPMSSVERLIADRLQPLAQQAAGRYSDAFLRAVDGALSVKPQDRPQSVAQFREMLGIEPAQAAPVPKAMTTSTGSWERTGAPTVVAPTRSNGKRAAIAALTVVLLGGGAWMYVAAPGGTPPPASASEAPPAAAAVIESAPAPVPVPVAMPPAPSPAPVVVPVIAPAAVPAPEPEPAVRPPAPAPRPVPTAAPAPAPVPPPRVEATARPPTVRPAPTPAPVVSAADQARCTDILQKASLQALSSSETDFLKRVCK